MYTKIQVVLDAAEPAALAEFWKLALGYVEQPPPQGFATWEEFGRSIGMRPEQFGDQTALIDPEGAGPRLFFQRVPEPKTAKNRVHLDVRVAPGVSGEEWKERVEAHVARLVEAGGTIAWRNDTVTGHSVVMRTWVVSHWANSCCWHIQQCPHEMLNGITTRSPGCIWLTSEPTSSTMPIGSWPRMSPFSRNGPNSSYRCRSEPQIAVEVMRTIASVGCSSFGSGTASTRTSRFPCQVTAFITASR